eukprot:scaffold15772_cov162-Cylindrotheca_fusiformis.AAC.7
MDTERAVLFRCAEREDFFSQLVAPSMVEDKTKYNTSNIHPFRSPCIGVCVDPSRLLVTDEGKKTVPLRFWPVD